MERDLPFSEKGRGIFIAALRDFSNNCEAPELTPHCPFYEVTQKGAVCGEQCRDLLAEYHAVERTIAVVDLGEGLAMYARRSLRPRRGPDDSCRPFDAAEIQLRDQDKPTDARHTVSLIKDSVDQLMISPSLTEDPENRSYIVHASVEELVRRGFSEAAILSALAESVFRVVLVWTALPLKKSGIRNPAGAPGWNDILAQWRVVHRIDADDTSNELFLDFVRGPSNKGIRNWLHSLTLAGLIDWKPPSSIRHLEEAEVVSLENRRRARWLIDRFTNTYIDKWSDAALHLEWIYLHGETLGCAPPSQMAIRKISADDISTTIANRASEEWQKSSSDRRSFKATDFTVMTAEHLRMGRYDAAAAIFEGLYALAPDDAEIINNLAFTLVPLDPVRALGLFEKAWRLSNHKNAITLANRIFTLRLLGRFDEAIAAASDLTTCDTYLGVAWLWANEGTERSLVLLSNQKVTDYINRQIMEISSVIPDDRTAMNSPGRQESV